MGSCSHGVCGTGGGEEAEGLGRLGFSGGRMVIMTALRLSDAGPKWGTCWPEASGTCFTPHLRRTGEGWFQRRAKKRGPHCSLLIPLSSPAWTERRVLRTNPPCPPPCHPEISTACKAAPWPQRLLMGSFFRAEKNTQGQRGSGEAEGGGMGKAPGRGVTDVERWPNGGGPALFSV